MRRVIVFASLLSSLALAAVAACGSDDDESPPATPVPEASTPDRTQPPPVDSGAGDTSTPPPPRVCTPRDAGSAEAGAYRCGRIEAQSNGHWGMSVAADLCGDVYTAECLFPGSGTCFEQIIRKWDQDCNVLWTKTLAVGAGYTAPGGAQLSVAPNGDLVVYGTFWGSTTLGGDTFTSPMNEKHGFIGRLTADGTHLWSRALGASGAKVDTGGVAIDALGNVVLTGSFTGSIDFGGGKTITKPTDGSTRTSYIARLDTGGNPIWVNEYAVTSCGSGCGFFLGDVTVHPVTGEIAFGGSLDHATVDFGGGAMTATTWRAVIVKLGAANGAHVFSKAYLNEGIGQGTGRVRYDGDGSLYATGDFAVGSTLDFGNGVTVSAGPSSNTGGGSWLVKFDANMVAQWAKSTVPAGAADGISSFNGLTLDPAGNLTGTGSYNGPTALGDGENVADSGYKSGVFVAKYQPDGGFLYKRAFEIMTDPNVCNPLVILGSTNGADQPGGALLTGAFSGTVDFGAGPTTSVPNWCTPDGGAWFYFARFEP